MYWVNLMFFFFLFRILYCSFTTFSKKHYVFTIQYMHLYNLYQWFLHQVPNITLDMPKNARRPTLIYNYITTCRWFCAKIPQGLPGKDKENFFSSILKLSGQTVTYFLAATHQLGTILSQSFQYNCSIHFRLSASVYFVKNK